MPDSVQVQVLHSYGLRLRKETKKRISGDRGDWPEGVCLRHGRFYSCDNGVSVSIRQLGVESRDTRVLCRDY